MSVENGTFGKLILGGKLIGLLKTNDLNLTTNMRDTSTKDSAGWKEIEPGQHSFKLNCEGLFTQELVNRFLYSTDFSNAAWAKDYPSITVTKNTGSAPDGSDTAALITWGTGTSLSQSFSGFVDGDIIVLSVYAKGTGTIFGALEDVDGSTDGTLVLSASWQRLEIPYTCTGGVLTASINKTSGTAVTLWGPMLQKAAFATSYKPSGWLFMELEEAQIANTPFTVKFTNEKLAGKQFRSAAAYISEGSLKAATEDNTTFTCAIEGTGELIIEDFT